MIKVLIADDHALVREGLKKVIGEEDDIEVVAEAQNSLEIFENLKIFKVDILLLDITMPGKSGLDIIKDLLNEFPGLSILILSMHPENSFAIRSLKLGASGYLSKDSAPGELVKAIRKIFSGSNYISSQLAEKLAGQVKSSNYEKLPHERLSDREFEVFRLIASGKTVTQIAEELKLSIATISTYRARILEKMNLKSNAEITYYAVNNNLGTKSM